MYYPLLEEPSRAHQKALYVDVEFMKQVGDRQLKSIKNGFLKVFLFFCASLIYSSSSLYAQNETFEYYLYISDFAQSFILIPTSDIGGGTTISSTYLAGRAPIYDMNNNKFGTCSASFLCMETSDGIYTDISNYLSADNGLIVSWLTPTTLINLEIDSIINGMVTECMVTASTKIGANPFYGQTFDLVVSSDNEKIYFEFTRTGTIF